MKHYDIIIIGAGPGGIFSAYELATKRPDLKIAVFEAGNRLEKRRCVILIKMEIGYNGESFDDFSQKNSLAKLSKGSDAKL